ncbi:3-keto-5-aminohexanoate cleavage protein, partial [Delftia acidovorans]
MATRTKAIITCAPTGAIHTPSMSPHLPVTAEQIARAAIDAAEAGAAIVHLHARDPRDGRPSQDPDLFRPFLKAIRAESDAIVNITTGGSPHMTVPERMRPVTE